MIAGMNGAQALIRTLVDGGVTTCFTNPGTSEMHFVAALDSVPEMRAIIARFEGVATGAADGYARMSGRPGATLLHLGSGLGNGLANLHNARKGRSPIVNIVGDHATYHWKYDAQLQSDIETVARNFSQWVRTSKSPESLGADAAEAIAAAQGPPGQVATLILPADVSWSDGAQAASAPPPPAPPVASDDALGSLEALVEALGAGGAAPQLAPASRPERPTGELTAEKACQAIAALLPEGAIVSDEAVTSGLTFASQSAGAPRHDVLTLTGGAIGQGLPVAVGAAVACPDRPVIALEGEGSGMYTIQSLWTMAREQLDVTVVIFNNRSYAILNVELERVGAQGGGPRAKQQLDLAGPDLDFVAIARGLGVDAVRPESADDFASAFERALAEPGPHLIEAVVPRVSSGLRLRAMPHALRVLEKLPRPVAKAAKSRLYP